MYIKNISLLSQEILEISLDLHIFRDIPHLHFGLCITLIASPGSPTTKIPLFHSNHHHSYKENHSRDSYPVMAIPLLHHCIMLLADNLINLRDVEKIIAFTLLIACKFRASNTFCIVVFLLVVGESVDKISSVSQIKKALILISSKCHFTYGFANIESFLQTLYQHLYLDTFE